jgi:hypothetical protein
MGHSQDWYEGKINYFQDQFEKQAVINVVNAVNYANQQIQLLALQGAIKLEKERTEALAFLFDQQAQRLIRYAFIQEALTEASNDYMGIMLTEAHKPLDLSLLFTFVAFAVVPEFAALANAAKVLADDWKEAIATAKAVGKVLDIGKYTSGTGGNNRTGAFGVINQVVREVLSRILDEEARMGVIVQAFTVALFAGAPRPLQLVQDFWSQAGLQTIQATGFSAAQNYSDALSDIILYDMLNAYTSQYVTISLQGQYALMMTGFPNTCQTLDSDKLKDIPNGVVKVSGLNDEQREKIYERFSNVSRPGRPAVSSWRDLVSLWGAAIPGYQTDRRVDARCFAPKY